MTDGTTQTMCARHEIEYGRPSDDCPSCNTSGSDSQDHGIYLGDGHSIGLQSDDVWDRYRSMRSDAQDRMNSKELTNIQFVALLLDVYALHLEDSP